MKTFALLIAFSMAPSVAFGTVPTEAQLAQSVRAMKMPSLERRLRRELPPLGWRQRRPK